MKKYFNNSMYYLAAAFIAYFLIEIYDEIVLLSNENFKGWTYWNIARILKSLLAITVIALFIKFMTIANRRKLFSLESSKLWVSKSTILLVIGAISFAESRFNGGESLNFAASIFISSFCYSMSNIFKEATAIKEDNDLTI